MVKRLKRDGTGEYNCYYSPVCKRLPHLQAFRERRGVTRYALAKAAGLSQHTIRKAEMGGLVQPETIRRIARTLGVQEKSLIGKDKDNENRTALAEDSA